jgi:hypothetical protein
MAFDETVTCSIAGSRQAVVSLGSRLLLAMYRAAFKTGENQGVFSCRRHPIHIFDFGVRASEFAFSSFGGIDEFDFQMSQRI